MIARLELMGEAQSTAQLYLSGKGVYDSPHSSDPRSYWSRAP